MTSTRHTYRPQSLLATLLTVLLLAACGSDESDSREQQPDSPQKTTASTLQLGTVSWTGDTRADATSTSMELCLASKQDGKPWYVRQGRVTALSESTWRSVLEVKKDTTYYIYGYMPADGVGSITLEGLDGEYTKGAVFHFSGLPAVTSEDICVLVGASENSTVTPGSFSHTGKEGENTVNLRFAHLYATLAFAIKVDAQYNELRRIRLRSMQLATSHSTADLSVTLTSGQAAPLTLDTLTTKGSGGTTDITVGTDGQGIDLTTAPQAVTGFLAPTFGGTVRLVSTYDVYDRSGNLLRENCRAENTLPDQSALASGQKKTLTLTVSPTYLYMLSDPDLNNPAVVVTE